MASIKANCRKVICIGRNYADHITELGNKPPGQPFFFLKPPSSILAPPHTPKQPILLPRGTQVHYEVELGLVIGPNKSSPNTPFKNLTFPGATTEAEKTTQALNCIKSFFVGIDLTARNVQDEAKRKGLPWTIAKGFDTFLPISESIPLSKIPDPYAATLHLSVNGETKQRDGTNLMLFRIPRMLADISRVMGLEEGDLVLTGTPKGVGRIVDGDRVVCGIEVDGVALEEGTIEIDARDAPDVEGAYVFRET